MTRSTAARASRPCRTYGEENCVCTLPHGHPGAHRCGGCDRTWDGNVALRLVQDATLATRRDPMAPPQRGLQSLKYPWPTLAVGESFVVTPGPGESPNGVMYKMVRLAYQWRQRNDRTKGFRARLSEGVVIVTRVA